MPLFFLSLTPLALVQAASAQPSQPAAPAPPSPTPPAPACDSEGHAGFDFWVGEWDVYATGSERQVAQSKIQRTHAGCAVIEHWMPARGPGGTSLNHFDPATGRWHQKWVGASPGAVEFSGGTVEGGMVLTGNWGSPAAPHQLIRMTYTAADDGSVRQHGEASLDHGQTWQTSFDFTYRPRIAASD